ncbi:MAG: hypothetical protein GX601_07175 [Anaerolineales bacterium]|nr:hypothetical protein [Anaerolineales bacterium]
MPAAVASVGILTAQDGGAGCVARVWQQALWHALPVSALVLALYGYWFGIADRYRVFLYEHNGATPFDSVTGSRYWMAGLVAAGVVLTLYTGVNWLAGRAASLRGRRYALPGWRRVWLLAAFPLGVGIPAITMGVNQPVLPWRWALASTVAALVGLALALMPGAWASRRPRALAWLTVQSLGLVPALFTPLVLEAPARGLGMRISTLAAAAIAISALAAGMAWLAATAGLAARRKWPLARASNLFAGGLCMVYLVLPLAHHLAATPLGYRYITTATNFFALSPALQLAGLAIAGGCAIGAAVLQRVLAARW